MSTVTDMDLDADRYVGVVSMVDGNLFDKLSRIGQMLRGKGKTAPFGGIQVRCSDGIASRGSH